MRVQGEALSAEAPGRGGVPDGPHGGRREYVRRRAMCRVRRRWPTALQEPGWNGWGNGAVNTRFQSSSQAGLTAADVPKLRLKWAFGFPGVLAARTQPAVVGGRVFTASEPATSSRSTRARAAPTGCTGRARR